MENLLYNSLMLSKGHRKVKLHIGFVINKLQSANKLKYSIISTVVELFIIMHSANIVHNGPGTAWALRI